MGETAQRASNSVSLHPSERTWLPEPFPAPLAPRAKRTSGWGATVAKGARVPGPAPGAGSGRRACAVAVVHCRPRSAPAPALPGRDRWLRSWLVAFAVPSPLSLDPPPPLSSWWLIHYLVLKVSRQKVARAPLKKPPQWSGVRLARGPAGSRGGGAHGAPRRHFGPYWGEKKRKLGFDKGGMMSSEENVTSSRAH